MIVVVVVVIAKAGVNLGVPHTIPLWLLFCPAVGCVHGKCCHYKESSPIQVTGTIDSW